MTNDHKASAILVVAGYVMFAPLWFAGSLLGIHLILAGID